MNHPSEWARYFDENTGSYRNKHKGSDVIRDTFMTIGKIFKKNIKDVAKKKLLKKLRKQSLKKRVRELVNLLLKKVRNKYEKYCKSEKNKNRCLRMQKRNLQIFFKTKHRKNQTPL